MKKKVKNILDCFLIIFILTLSSIILIFVIFPITLVFNPKLLINKKNKMQIIILKHGREISYYDPELKDFILSEEPIECPHSYLEEANLIKKEKKIKGGTISTSEITYDELDLIKDY